MDKLEVLLLHHNYVTVSVGNLYLTTDPITKTITSFTESWLFLKIKESRVKIKE